MKTEIIAVGTELLLGQIANTNAQWISRQLAIAGLPVFYHSVVGDNIARTIATLKYAEERSDVIIVTGGLGPTEDDLTRDAAKEILGQNLVEDQTALEKIKQYYIENKRVMSENNRKQSLVFEDALVLPNSEGMAPGQIIKKNHRIWVFLPGVPSEMKTLMNEYVLPYFSKELHLPSEIASEMMRFIGIGESALETKLFDLIQSQRNPTLAPLASDGEVGLRITATGDTDADARKKIEQMKEQVLQRTSSYYYGSDEVTIEEKVRNLLKERQMTVGSAESLTGGLFMEKMISLPGASRVSQGSLVAYTAFTKKRILQVPDSIIKEYGTISAECAEVMALNAKSLLHADVTVSFTGVAGPEASEGQKPGTVFIGLKIGDRKAEVSKYHFFGSREKIRHLAVKKGYELIYHSIKNNS